MDMGKRIFLLTLLCFGGESAITKSPSLLSSSRTSRNQEVNKSNDFVSRPSDVIGTPTLSEEVKCICDGTCEHVAAQECPFGVTLDYCRCCIVCARGPGEPCGGGVGKCAEGLHCKADIVNVANNTGSREMEGRCSRDEGGCGGHLEVRYGCDIDSEGKCVCSSRSACPGEELFLFDTEEECRSRVGYLIAKKDLEVAESPTMSATDDCAQVQCPSVELTPCPPDSHRLPFRRNSRETPRLSICCPGSPRKEECQCNPSLECLPVDCPEDFIPQVVANATNKPGGCCPKYRCVPTLETSGKTLQTTCNHKGHEYDAGESWSNKEDCTECKCLDGVMSCKPIKCEAQTGCPAIHTPPNSCCPVCISDGGCVTTSGKLYNNSQTWEEDPCTTCTCNEGRRVCHATMCQKMCSNPTLIPGECCPRCDLTNGAEKDSSCPFRDCHFKECRNGFKLDRKGCPTCNCSDVPSCKDKLTQCDLHCPFGFQVDKHQCPVCNCRTDLSPSHKEIGESQGNRVLSPLRECHISDGMIRYEGEEWVDQCRRCVCKNGREMCSLITCNPPNCEDPVFFPGECCPRCPDEPRGHSNFSISVCQSSDGSQRLEGEIWTMASCFLCTCHFGQVLCAAPECPPTPCQLPNPVSSHQCCPSCPANENAITTNSSHPDHYCLSDDSMRKYADGASWKVGACQSCICERGRTQCFSSGKCPQLQCDKPVLAKNQCCPICLDYDGQQGTVPSDLHPGSDSYCSVLLGIMLGLSLAIGVIITRQFLCRRICTSLPRLSKVKKAALSIHSSNSSQETPPATPDCFYKCGDYNKYHPSSCAQLSEQKLPLFTSSSSSSNNGGNHNHNSEKV